MLFVGVALAVLQQVTGINVFLYFAPEIFPGLGRLPIGHVANGDRWRRQPGIHGAGRRRGRPRRPETPDDVGAIGMGVALTALGLAAYWQWFHWSALVLSSAISPVSRCRLGRSPG